MVVRVEVVQDVEPRVGQIAEDVLREQGRRDQEQQMQPGDRADREPRADRSRRQQDRDVGSGREPQPEVEQRSGRARVGEGRAEIPEGPQQPARRAARRRQHDA